MMAQGKRMTFAVNIVNDEVIIATTSIIVKIINKQALRLHATLRLDPKGVDGIDLILFDNFHAIALHDDPAFSLDTH